MDAQVKQDAEHAMVDLHRLARRGLVWLALAFFGGVAWMVWAPLDEGVPAPAQVAIETQRKSVQHFSGGIVRVVHVKEGEWVQRDQVLFELDTAAAKANLESVRQRDLSLRISQDRLRAEQANAAEIVWSSALEAVRHEPSIQVQMDTQTALLRARRQALQAELAGLQESIASQQAVAQASLAALQSRQRQLSLLQREIDDMRPVVAQGYLPRNGLRQLERQEADIQAQSTDLQGRYAQSQASIAELRQRDQRARLEYRKELETQLAAVTAEIQANVDKLSALTDELARSEVRSPATGQVVGLAVQTVGAVIQPGQKLMDVVPEGEPLVLDVHIPPHIIDRVQAGLTTDVRFSAFAHSPHLVAQGRVQSVSHDLITDPQRNMAYYLARVVLTPEGMQTLGDRRLQPGMPAEVVIKTGERSMLTYLLHPLLKRVAASLNEE